MGIHFYMIPILIELKYLIAMSVVYRIDQHIANRYSI